MTTRRADMNDREAILPLLIGLVVALGLHVVALPLSARLFLPHDIESARIVLSNVEAPSRVSAGDDIEVAFHAKSTGSTAQAGPWRVDLLLSDDASPGGNDVTLTAFKSAEMLPADKPARFSVQATIPARAQGPMHLIVRGDGSHASTLIDIIVPRRPDLLPFRLEAPATGHVGEAIAVLAHVTNTGNAAATPPASGWSDSVYLSRDALLDDADAELGKAAHHSSVDPGAQYAASFDKLVVPPGWEGDAFVIVAVDRRNDVEEYPKEDNNNLAAAIRLEAPRGPEQKAREDAAAAARLPARPDLTPTELAAPEAISLEKPFDLRYTVANRGGAPAAGKGWLDMIYLSRDRIIDDGDIILTAINRTDAAPPGRTYTGTETRAVVAADRVGEGYLILRTDAQNDIDETPNESNNELAVPVRIVAPMPEPEEILGSDKAPEEMVMSWISHEDFQKLQGQRSRVQQPVVQQSAPPVDNAPLTLDATPAAPPAVKPTPAMQEGAPAAAPVAGEPAQQIAAASRVTEPALPMPQPRDQITPPAKTDQPEAPQPTDMQVAKERTEAAVPQESGRTAAPAVGQPTEQPAAKPPRVIAQDASADGPPASREDGALDPMRLDEAAGPAQRNTPPRNARETVAAVPSMPVPAVVPLPAATPGESTKPMEQKPAVKTETTRAATTGEPTNVPKDQAGPARVITAGKPNPSPAPQQAKPGKDPVTTPAVAAGAPSNPTSAPLDQKESPLFDTNDPIKVQPGKTLTGKGIEIHTVAPRFSPVTRVSLLPGNPEIRVWFDRNGKVVDAQLVRSSGYDSVDTPILACIYRWYASGEEFKKRNRELQLDFTIILTDTD